MRGHNPNKFFFDNSVNFLFTTRVVKNLFFSTLFFLKLKKKNAPRQRRASTISKHYRPYLV